MLPVSRGASALPTTTQLHGPDWGDGDDGAEEIQGDGAREDGVDVGGGGNRFEV